jgi:hypothetical protein
MAASTIESLRRFDLEQAGKRRGVVERHNIEDAEPFAGVAVDLLAGLDYDCIGGLAEIVPVRRVESVPKHASSVPGPDASFGRWSRSRVVPVFAW